MNRKFLAIFLVVAVGCGSSHSTAIAQDDECAKMKDLKMEIGIYELYLNSKKPICVVIPEGGTGSFKIDIKDKTGGDHTIEKGHVMVHEKDDSVLEIRGDNSDDVGKIAVTVSGDPGEQDEFRFWIKVEEIGKLDPRIKVKDNETMMMLKIRELDELRDTLGLSWEEIYNFGPRVTTD